MITASVWVGSGMQSDLEVFVFGQIAVDAIYSSCKFHVWSTVTPHNMPLEWCRHLYSRFGVRIFSVHSNPSIFSTQQAYGVCPILCVPNGRYYCIHFQSGYVSC